MAVWTFSVVVVLEVFCCFFRCFFKTIGEDFKSCTKPCQLLLGGAHFDNYKRMGHTYLSNLWNNFKEYLHCGSSYEDINPKDFDKALDYIGTWRYQEV